MRIEKMSDAAGRFREKLEELLTLGRRSGMCLTAAQIRDVLKEEHLTDDQLQLVYTYLDQMAIRISDPSAGEELSSGQERAGALEAYLEELDRIASLPADLELQLFERAADGDREAAGILTERYLATVCDLASEYESAHPKVDAEDLVQEANTGLVLGVASLEKEKTLAAYRARLLNSVSAYLEKSVKELEEMMTSDQRVVNRMNQLADSIRELERQLGHRPSVEEISAFLEIPAEDINSLLRLCPEE